MLEAKVEQVPANDITGANDCLWTAVRYRCMLMLRCCKHTIYGEWVGRS